MKYKKKECVIVIAIVLLAVAFTQVKGSPNRGEQCDRLHCIQQQGYVGYGRNVTSRRTSWRLLNEHGQFTTFVLILKNIQIPAGPQAPWLYIAQQHYTLPKEYRVDKSEKRIFVFKDTKEVEIRILNTINLSFKLDFYVGCEVVEDRDITIRRTSEEYTNNNPFPNVFDVPKKPTSCWFFVPTIQEQIVQPQNAYWEAVYRRYGYFFPVRTTTRDIEIQETYLTLQNVSLANDTVSVVDLLTGNELMSVTGEERLILSVLIRSNASVIKYVERDLSSLIFINLQLQNERLPSETHFTLKGKALQQSDLDCMERESKCRFNIGQKNFNCTAPDLPPELLVGVATRAELTQTVCPAFDDIFNNILVWEQVMERGVVRCKRHHYCRRKCGKFRKRQCRQECYLYKEIYKLCGSRSIFA